MSDTRIVPARKEYTISSTDEALTRLCLDKTMGDVVHNREHAATARAYTVNSLVFNAIFEQDVELIKTITGRVDGTVPDAGKREEAANILGDALEDVLSYTSGEMLTITPDDPVIIALAKVLVFKATRPAGTNQLARKERNLAASMILERTGGRKTEPTRPSLETEYVEPEWMRLPDGEEEEEHG